MPILLLQHAVTSLLRRSTILPKAKFRMLVKVVAVVAVAEEVVEAVVEAVVEEEVAVVVVEAQRGKGWLRFTAC